jgi:hypothetical protein
MSPSLAVPFSVAPSVLGAARELRRQYQRECRVSSAKCRVMSAILTVEAILTS